jgi:hypothetical protein
MEKQTAARRLIDAIVDYHIDLERIAGDSVQDARLRLTYLLEHPEAVNDGITLQFLDAEMEMTDLPSTFWDEVAEMQDVKFTDLHKVPVQERGEAWEMARAIRVAVAYRQAAIESGAIAGAMQRGTQLGNTLRSLGEKVDVAELATSINLKKQIKERRANAV